MKDRVEDGNGGIIAIDKHGNFGIAFNTKLMVWARIDGDTGKMTYGMGIGESEEEPLVPEPRV
jgi:isoaspartyl peptidase/L-asparaginase-like protein (Ntn-hydrolase superfamily)